MMEEVHLARTGTPSTATVEALSYRLRPPKQETEIERTGAWEFASSRSPERGLSRDIRTNRAPGLYLQRLRVPRQLQARTGGEKQIVAGCFGRQAHCRVPTLPKVDTLIGSADIKTTVSDARRTGKSQRRQSSECRAHLGHQGLSLRSWHAPTGLSCGPVLADLSPPLGRGGTPARRP